MTPEQQREHWREYQRQWRAANPEKSREIVRRWRKAHPEKAREIQRIYRKAHPEKFREYMRCCYNRWYGRLRAQVLDLLGGKCVRCGLSEPQLLQIDHINGKGHAERKSLSATQFLRKVLADPTGYQLLCPTCNWRKRIERGEYKKGA